MVVEIELNMQPCRENGAGSASSHTSIRAQKSAHTPRIGSANGRSIRSSISSRARQIKDHEMDPFLSVDVMPKSNSQSSFRKDPGTTRYSAKASEHSQLTTSSSRPVSVYSDGHDNKLPDVLSRYASAMRPAFLMSQARFHQRPNVYVKRPFKHATDVPDREKRGMSPFPGQALVLSTALAVQIANKVLHDHRHQTIEHVRGRLLKARLKTLDPVTVEGPTISHCQGITSEIRSPHLCNRRTYQRLMTILSKAYPSKDITQSVGDPGMAHRMSEASSLGSEIHEAFITCPDFDHKLF